MPDIIALTPAIASVARSPACRLKCAGSMPTAAKPVMTPLAPPAIAAAARPRHHTRKLVQALTRSSLLYGDEGSARGVWVCGHIGRRRRGTNRFLAQRVHGGHAIAVARACLHSRVRIRQAGVD